MPADTKPAVLFDADICDELRISRTTLKRLRRARAFPIPELPSLDKKHRYARIDVEAFLARTKLALRRRA
jgi:Helix-turn-helix domain